MNILLCSFDAHTIERLGVLLWPDWRRCLLRLVTELAPGANAQMAHRLSVQRSVRFLAGSNLSPITSLRRGLILLFALNTGPARPRAAGVAPCAFGPFG